MRKSLKAIKWLWIISALLAIVVVGVLIIPRDGHNFEVDGIYYETVDDISNLVKVTYKGNDCKAFEHEYSGTVVIPEKLTYKGRTYKVTEIGDYAFSDCSRITSVTIPASVWHIGINAFGGCCGLKEVHISNLSAWCELSFWDALDDSGESPFNYAEELYLNGELVTDLVVPEDVTKIGAHAFEGYEKLKSVVLPKGIDAIFKSAFRGCSNLKSINFPDSLYYIGPYAFDGTAWFENLADGEVYTGKHFYKYKGEMPANTSIIIKEGTETICETAFIFCEGLVSIALPKTMRCIHDFAFDGCVNVKEIYCKAPTPPHFNSFYSSINKDVKLYVPRGKLEIYKNDDLMGCFNNVMETVFED